MGNSKLLISGFLTFAIISGVCFQLGMSIVELPRIIAVDALPEFKGGGVNACHKCEDEPKCQSGYDDPCYSHSGDESGCNSSWETHHDQDGDKVVRNSTTNAILRSADDLQECALRASCSYIASTGSCIVTTYTYPRWAWVWCETVPR